MARYRLRFVLQELDLPAGVTTIGRSLECQLTIDDPLVSRRHARITVGADGAVVEDLGSRNGVKINGVVVRGSTTLHTGDRLRIGTQELIFSSVDDDGKSQSRATGQLRLCARCRLPYPREMLACPACEATEQTDEDTPTAGHGEGGDWTVKLFVEALDRALRLGRVTEAEGLIKKAADRVDEIVDSGGRVDGDTFAALALHAMGTSIAVQDARWVVWALGHFSRSGSVPPDAFVAKVAEAAVMYPRPVLAAVKDLLVTLETRGSLDTTSELDALFALRDISAGATNEDSPRRVPVS